MMETGREPVTPVARAEHRLADPALTCVAAVEGCGVLSPSHMKPLLHNTDLM